MNWIHSTQLTYETYNKERGHKSSIFARNPAPVYPYMTPGAPPQIMQQDFDNIILGKLMPKNVSKKWKMKKKKKIGFQTIALWRLGLLQLRAGTYRRQNFTISYNKVNHFFMVVWLRRFDIPLFYKIFSHRPKGNNALE